MSRKLFRNYFKTCFVYENFSNVPEYLSIIIISTFFILNFFKFFLKLIRSYSVNYSKATLEKFEIFSNFYKNFSIPNFYEMIVSRNFFNCSPPPHRSFICPSPYFRALILTLKRLYLIYFLFGKI